MLAPSAFKPTIRSSNLVIPNLLNAVWILSCIPAEFAFFTLSTLKYRTFGTLSCKNEMYIASCSVMLASVLPSVNTEK